MFANKTHVIYASLVVFLFSACSVVSVKASDFDRICEIVQNNINISKPVDEKAALISEKVLTTLDKSSKAAIAFRAVASANPNQKYSLFKEIAEEHTGQPWDCPEMATLSGKSVNK